VKSFDSARQTARLGQIPLVSSARVLDFRRGRNDWSYTLILPKKELSADGKSAKLVLELWDDVKKKYDSYPLARFEQPIVIPYQIK
jgi:hypothetical protein